MAGTASVPIASVDQAGTCLQKSSRLTGTASWARECLSPTNNPVPGCWTMITRHQHRFSAQWHRRHHNGLLGSQLICDSQNTFASMFIGPVRELLLLHLTDEKTEAQGGPITRPHSQCERKWIRARSTVPQLPGCAEWPKLLSDVFLFPARLWCDLKKYTQLSSKRCLIFSNTLD